MCVCARACVYVCVCMRVAGNSGVTFLFFISLYSLRNIRDRNFA